MNAPVITLYKEGAGGGCFRLNPHALGLIESMGAVKFVQSETSA